MTIEKLEEVNVIITPRVTPEYRLLREVSDRAERFLGIEAKVSLR
jgi:hypothetical protein